MISRDTSEARMPSWPMEMPSDTAMVMNSIGKPPAARTPSLASLAKSVEGEVAGGDLVPRRRHAHLRLVPVVVGHADGAEHRPGGGTGRAVGDLVAADLHPVRAGDGARCVIRRTWRSRLGAAPGQLCGVGLAAQLQPCKRCTFSLASGAARPRRPCRWPCPWWPS